MKTIDRCSAEDTRAFRKSVLATELREVLDAKIPVLFPEEIRGLIEYVKQKAFESHVKRAMDRGETVYYESFLDDLMRPQADENEAEEDQP